MELAWEYGLLERKTNEMKTLTRKEYLHYRRWGHGIMFGLRTWFDNRYISHWKYQEKERGWKAKILVVTDITDIFEVLNVESWCSKNLTEDCFFHGWGNDQYVWAFKSIKDAATFKLMWS